MTRVELKSFIEQYGKEIFSFCLYLTRDRQEAEELYQEIFLTAMEQIDKIDINNNPKSYLLSVAVKKWNNRIRKSARRFKLMEEKYMPNECLEGNGIESNTPEAQVIKNEQNERVRKCVDSLPNKLRNVVILYYMEQLSIPEIADILVTPKGTVKSRLFKARKILQEQLVDSENFVEQEVLYCE